MGRAKTSTANDSGLRACRNCALWRYASEYLWLNSPLALAATGRIKQKEQLFLAGQITGVEGYVESTASGLVAGINAARMYQQQDLLQFPLTTAIGGLMNYIVTADSKHFQPMNINFSLLPGLEQKIRNKKEKNGKIAQRALEDLEKFLEVMQS